MEILYLDQLSGTIYFSKKKKKNFIVYLISLFRSVSKDRGGEKKTPFGPPTNANAAFDKYFDKAEAAENSKSTPGATPDARQAATTTRTATTTRPGAASTAKPTEASGKSHPPVAVTRTYRRF